MGREEHKSTSRYCAVRGTLVGAFVSLSAVVLLHLLLLVADVRSQSPSDGTFSIAVLSDLHIGEGVSPFYNGQTCNSTIRLQKAIGLINERIQQFDIRWVFITGDITSSAEPTQFLKAQELLSTLEVPFFPLLGNHDVWPYNTDMETLTPIGDQLFASYFNESFTQEYLARVNGSEELNLQLFYSGLNVTWNPVNKVNSQFQNYMMTVGNSTNRLIFVCLDWNTRDAAILWDKNKGALPEGGLHNFPGGTLPWLKERLAEISMDYTYLSKTSPSDSNPIQIIFLQHQPYKTPWFIPRWTFTFNDEDEREIQIAMEMKDEPTQLPLDTYWGVIGGHLHRWWNSNAFDFPFEWKHFWQWETNACKGQWNDSNIYSGFTIARFEDYRLAELIAVQPPPSP